MAGGRSLYDRASRLSVGSGGQAPHARDVRRPGEPLNESLRPGLRLDRAPELRQRASLNVPDVRHLRVVAQQRAEDLRRVFVSLLLKGDIEALMAAQPPQIVLGADDGIRIIGLGLSGRRDEAREALARVGHQSRIQSFHMWRSHLSAWLDRRIDDMISTLSSFGSLKIFDDPEAIFQEGWLFCDAGDHQRGLEYMQRGVARGYFPAPTLTLSPQFDPLRGVPAFQLLVSEAEAGRQRALAAFRDAGGERLLGR